MSRRKYKSSIYHPTLWDLYERNFDWIDIIMRILVIFSAIHSYAVWHDNIYAIIALYILAGYYIWCYDHPKKEKVYALAIYIYAIIYYILNWETLKWMFSYLWESVVVYLWRRIVG